MGNPSLIHYDIKDTEGRARVYIQHLYKENEPAIEEYQSYFPYSDNEEKMTQN